LLRARHNAATKELAWVVTRRRYADAETPPPSVATAEKAFRTAEKEIAEAERKLREPIEDKRNLTGEVNGIVNRRGFEAILAGAAERQHSEA